jgi:hypothetical protein
MLQKCELDAQREIASLPQASEIFSQQPDCYSFGFLLPTDFFPRLARWRARSEELTSSVSWSFSCMAQSKVKATVSQYQEFFVTIL